MNFKSKKAKVVFGSLIFLLFVLAGTGYYFYSQATATSNLKFSKNDLLQVNDSTIDASVSAGLDSLSNLQSQMSDSSLCYRIMITGVDSRLGTGCPHADANHLLSIYPDKGYIDIISIPRGTLAPAGQSDSSGQNYLANTRAIKGRDRYLGEVCRISDIDTIPYFAEFGFSQAVGLIKLLGFGKNALSTLRVLRARKSFPQGDYQRCYNQGQFIRQMILKHFEAMKTPAGGIILSGALALVESNLPKDTATMLVARLIKSGFPKDLSSVSVRLKPSYTQVEKFNFMDQKSIDNLHNHIVSRAPHDSTFTREKTTEELSNKMYDRLTSLINNVKNNIKSPDYVISRLKPVNEQKAWYQIEDIVNRERIHSQIYSLLRAACVAKKDTNYIKVLDSENNAEIKAFVPLTKKKTKVKYSFRLLGKEYILGEY